MVTGYATLSNMGLPYAVLGADPPSVLIIPGIEPEHRVPDGLRLQGIRGAFEQIAEQRSLAVAWRASRPADEMSLDAIADDYVDLARELELTDMAIVGISTGSPMAIETAARLGSRCTQLALVAGGAYLSQQGRSLLQRAVAHAQNGQWRRLAREQIAAFYPGLFGSAVLAPVAWLVPGLYGEPEDPDHFVGLTRVVAETNLRSRCKDVSARSLVINGTRDVLYPPEIAQETALLLADGELITVPRAGHGVFKSHAGRVNRLLLNYLLG